MAFFSSFAVVCLLFSVAVALEFDVGDEHGWKVPKIRDEPIYNHWASKNRFLVGDTVRFKYKKDSVMVVTEDEYESCKSSHPIFFSNSGHTSYELDRSGTFYFISGVAGHCERGQRMIIKVLPQINAPVGALLENGTSSAGYFDSGGVAPVAVSGVTVALVMVGTSSLLGYF